MLQSAEYVCSGDSFVVAHAEFGFAVGFAVLGAVRHKAEMHWTPAMLLLGAKHRELC